MVRRPGPIASLVTALRFLTIVPVPGPPADGRDALGRAAWWFPLVGLALGGALALIDRLLSPVAPPLVAAVLVLSTWKLSTGGLHLDGLADCLDGLAATSPERRLAIMRDSRIGVFGALGLVASFGLGTAALAELPLAPRAPVLVLAPAIGRVTPLLAGLILRAAAPGLGASFLASLPRAAGLVNVAGALGLGWLLLGAAGAAITFVALATSLAISAYVARRLGGLTGDVLGAGVELAELAFLVAAAACAHRGLIGALR